MADQRLLDLPGWARLAAAGPVDPPDAAVVDRVRRQVALAVQQERIRMLLPVAVPLVRRRRRRRRLVAIMALSLAAGPGRPWLDGHQWRSPGGGARGPLGRHDVRLRRGSAGRCRVRRDGSHVVRERGA